MTLEKWFALVSKTVGFVLVCSLLAISPVSSASAQGATVKAQPSTTSPMVNSTFTVDITVSGVQNLYALSVSLVWNPTVLRVMSATSLLGVESHPDGVLHENITVVEEGASQGGAYQLVAYSQIPAVAFSGSGKIATLSFDVLRASHSDLTLETQLWDGPAVVGLGNSISHSDSSSAVDAIVPEFSTVFAVVVFLVLAASVLVFAKRRIEKGTSSA